MDDSAPSLTNFLGILPQHLNSYPIDTFRVSQDDEVIWDANWKTALDAFLECYHCDIVHPELGGMTDTYDVQYDLYDNGLSRMILGVGYAPKCNSDGETVGDALKRIILDHGGDPEKYSGLSGANYQKAVIETKRAWAQRNKLDYFSRLSDSQIANVWNYYIFPNVTINLWPNALLVQRFLPDVSNPSRSVYSAISLNLPVADPNYRLFDIGSVGQGNAGGTLWTGDPRPPRARPKTEADLGYVLAQDARLVPHVQAGLRSRSFKGYRLGEQEIRIRHYLSELDRYLNR
jgi:phenylpropionate dioxygenase-like ring-hydroxylating dioxygenase large terminal subunit